MLICEDERGIIRDIYYPHVGLENHCNLIRIGIYDLQNGEFSWFDNWKIKQSYKSAFNVKFFDELDKTAEDAFATENVLISPSNIGETIFENTSMGLRITVLDAVHPSINYFCRIFEVENTSPHPRNLRLFSNHNYNILENKIGETAVVDRDVLIHYKRDRYFLHGSSPRFDQYAVGIAEWKGLQGTWRDLEDDGILSGNVVAHGSVDSTLAWTISGLRPEQINKIHLWMAIGKAYSNVIKNHKTIKEMPRSHVYRVSFNFWNSFIERITTLPEGRGLFQLPERVKDSFYRSLMAMVAHMDINGSVIASCDSDIKQFGADLYTYCWPRDAAWACIALDKARYHHLSAEVFEFLSRAITKRGCLLHKYTPAGNFGSTWHPVPMIQIDETGLPLFALYHNWLISRDVWITGRYFSSFVHPAAEYLVRSIDKSTGLPVSSFDLWEERKSVHTYSACTVYAGLRGAAELARVLGDCKSRELWLRASDTVKNAILKLYDPDLGRFKRSISDSTLDSSLFAVWYFGVLPPDDDRVARTMQAIEKELTRASGGIARYPQDHYQGHMNAWIICTLWLAQWYIALGELDRALVLVSWCTEHSHSSGHMPEQVADDGAFRSVLPLMWSHCTFVLTVLEYLEAQRSKMRSTRNDFLGFTQD